MRILSQSFSLWVGVNRLSSGVSLDSRRRKSVLSVFIRSDLDNSGVNSTSDAVLHFDIELGDYVGFEGLIFFKVFLG